MTDEPNPNDRVVGAVLAAALDMVKHQLTNPDGWRLALYLGREDDPENAYLVGNVEPEQLHAAIAILNMGASRLGTVTRDGVITEEPR